MGSYMLPRTNMDVLLSVLRKATNFEWHKIIFLSLLPHHSSFPFLPSIHEKNVASEEELNTTGRLRSYSCTCNNSNRMQKLNQQTQHMFIVYLYVLLYNKFKKRFSLILCVRLNWTHCNGKRRPE